MSVPGQGEVGPDPPPPPPPPPEPLPDPLVPLPTPTPLEPTPSTDPLALTLQSLADRVDALEKTGSFAPGMIAWTAGPDAPPGWLIADGAAFDMNMYAALAIICPTGFLPNLVDKTVVGAGVLYALLSTGGAASLTLTGAQSGMPAHMHTIAAATGSTTPPDTGTSAANTTGSTTPGVTGASAAANTGSTTPAGGTTSTDGSHTHPAAAGQFAEVGSGGSFGFGAGTLTVQSHTSTGTNGSHSHTVSGAAHTHTVPSHTHSSAAHTHTTPAHSHTSAAHTHTLPDTDNTVATNASAPISTLSPYVALTPLIHI